VGGLWRTEVELKEEATWFHLKKEIEKMTGILSYNQKLKPDDELEYNKCELEEGDDVFCDWKFENGLHPLHHAAEDGNIEAIRSWIVSGADINVRNKNKTTPLMCACLYLKEECVAELVRLGANVNLIDKHGETALYKIIYNYNLEKIERIAKMLMLTKAGCDITIYNRRKMAFIKKLKLCYCNLATKLEEWLEEMEQNK